MFHDAVIGASFLRKEMIDRGFLQAYSHLPRNVTRWHGDGVKPLLYVYRVLLMGIHLMRTGEVEANLVRLNEEFRLAYIGELVARKVAGAERGTLPEGDYAFHEGERMRLEKMLREAHEKTHLAEAPTATEALNDLLVRLRLE
jgi:uncharacterized protein